MQTLSISSGAGSPFRLNTLPQGAFPHASWIRAERQALALVGWRGRLLLLGQPGTGKTFLLRSLNLTFKGRGVSVHQFRSGDPLDNLADEDVLLIDEAALLGAAELEKIIRLPNVLVMAGLPSLPERLTFYPDAFCCMTLEPLAPEDVARFVVARLTASGRPRGMFTPEALVVLARRSNGLLRLVIILAGAAMFIAEQRGAARVTGDDVADAAAMRAVLPETTILPAAPTKKTLGQELRSEIAVRDTPKTGPTWPGLVPANGLQLVRPVGLTAWVCASLAVVGVAIAAARGVRLMPVLAVHEVQGSSAPKMANVAIPDLVLPPAPQPALSTSVPMAATMAPVQAVATLPPAVEPVFPPETGQSNAGVLQVAQGGVDGTVQLLPVSPAPPSTLSNEVEASITVIAFTGPILNETMGQNGHLSLQLRIQGAHGPVAALFHASKGLIGSGVLTGDIKTDGRITLSGRLMMGRNPFDCALHATFEGERLVGAATFVHATRGAAAHSSFILTRL